MSTNDTFLPVDFIVPERLQADQFQLRVLTVNDVVKDYDAVVTSIEHLQGIFGPRSQWPAKDISLEQDLIDLGWHQKEYQRRTSFAYTVMSLDEKTCLGCVYLYPTNVHDFDCEAYCWIRASHTDQLDQNLFKVFKKWLEEKWPFQKVAFPGRNPDWDSWYKLTA